MTPAEHRARLFPARTEAPRYTLQVYPDGPDRPGQTAATFAGQTRAFFTAVDLLLSGDHRRVTVYEVRGGAIARGWIFDKLAVFAPIATTPTPTQETDPR